MLGKSRITLIALLGVACLISITGCIKHYVKHIHSKSDYSCSLYAVSNGKLCVLKAYSSSMARIWGDWSNPKYITVHNPKEDWDLLGLKYRETTHDEWIVPLKGTMMVRPRIKGAAWRPLQFNGTTPLTLNASFDVTTNAHGLLIHDAVKINNHYVYSIKDGSCTVHRYNSIGMPVVEQGEAYYFGANGDLMKIIAGSTHPSVFLPAKFWRAHAAPDWNHRLLEKEGLTYCGFQIVGFLKSKVLIAQDLSKGYAHPWRSYEVNSQGKLRLVSLTITDMFHSASIIWNGPHQAIWGIHDSISGILLNRWDGEHLVSTEFFKKSKTRTKGMSVTDWIIYEKDGVVIVRSLSDSSGLGNKSVIEAFRARYRHGGIVIGPIQSIPGAAECCCPRVCAVSGGVLWVAMEGGDLKSIKLR